MTREEVHSMNNKLCGLMGYIDLLSDIVTNPKALTYLGSMSRVCHEINVIVLKYKYAKSSPEQGSYHGGDDRS